MNYHTSVILSIKMPKIKVGQQVGKINIVYFVIAWCSVTVSLFLIPLLLIDFNKNSMILHAQHKAMKTYIYP